MVAALTSCSVDPGLRALQKDPMATWSPAGVLSEDRYEEGAHQESGFYSYAHLTRTLHMRDAEAAKAATGQAREAAKADGWKEDRDSSFLLKSLGGNVHGALSVRLADTDGSLLYISLSG
jgi:hypothetical protein